jgi:beta-glucanase (GH16 family)
MFYFDSYINNGKYDVWWKKYAVKSRPDLPDGQLEMSFEKHGNVVFAGHINTDCKFEQTGGYFEARILMIKPDAKQSTFWLFPNGGTEGIYRRFFMLMCF